MARRQTKSDGKKALTCIHRGIHCAATPVELEVKDEPDRIAIQHFLDTLAEVALAIASRDLARDQDGGQVAERSL